MTKVWVWGANFKFKGFTIFEIYAKGNSIMFRVFGHFTQELGIINLTALVDNLVH
jgi:hypothetical protein